MGECVRCTDGGGDEEGGDEDDELHQLDSLVRGDQMSRGYKYSPLSSLSFFPYTFTWQ